MFGISTIASAADAQISCPGAPNTYVYEQAWGDGARKFSAGLNDNDVQIIKMTIPTSVPMSTHTRYGMSGGEWKDNGVPRNVKISNKPCEFNTEFSGKSFSVDFYVNDTPVVLKQKPIPRYKVAQPTFKPGETVYINIKSDNGCYGSCNIFWQFGGWPAK